MSQRKGIILYLSFLWLLLFPMATLADELGDFVWNDLNGNGVQDGGEPGVGGITVQLWQCSMGNPNTLLATTNTDSSGAYVFGELNEMAGYAVRFILHSGYAFTLERQGSDDAIDSDADPLTGYTRCVNISPDNFDLDAGLRSASMVPTLTQWGMIIFVVLAGLGAVYFMRRQKRAER
jgi:hypothetical protein